MRGSRFGKGIALMLVAALGGLSAGCFGKFQLTRKLYDVNQSIDDKYIRSAATWIFVIPYAVTGLLDFVIFNVIEFWTGENLVASAQVTKVDPQGNGKTVLTLSRDGSATVAVIERYEGERLVSTLRVRDDGTGKGRRDRDGGGIERPRDFRGRGVRRVGGRDGHHGGGNGHGEVRGDGRPGAGSARGPDRVGSRAGVAGRRGDHPPGRRRSGSCVRGLSAPRARRGPAGSSAEAAQPNGTSELSEAQRLPGSMLWILLPCL